jgi:hypothetical protein
MKYLRRLRAFCECLPIIMAGWSLELQDWEFIDKTHSFVVEAKVQTYS